MHTATPPGYCHACGCLSCACAEYAKAREVLAPAAEESALESFVLLPTVADQVEAYIAREGVDKHTARGLRDKMVGRHFRSGQDVLAALYNDSWS